MQPLADAFWSFLTNPNVAYLLLIMGLWSVVLAVTTPGTGVAEGAAVICLALAAVGLIRLPVSLAGLGLIGLAFVLFFLEAQFSAHSVFIAAGTVALIAGSLLLFRATPGQAALSWLTVLVVSLVTSVVFGFLVTQGLTARRLPVAQDEDRVVGGQGVARTEVGVSQPGTVYVGGELWSAIADEPIPSGSEVVVISREELKLKVARAKVAKVEAQAPG